MRDWIQGDYQEWLDKLRSAESLLPEESYYRDQIQGVREEIETMRREWKDRSIPPKFDLFLQMVDKPLVETADQLQREIEKRMDEKEFVLVDEGEVPERYRERVAEYFKRLSETESLN